MIEGVGDEVVHFFAVVLIIVLALLAWWSTSITEGPLIRTVLILERRTRNRTTAETVQVQPSVSDSENGIDTGQEDNGEDSVETETLELSEDKEETENAPAAAAVVTNETATNVLAEDTSSNRSTSNTCEGSSSNSQTNETSATVNVNSTSSSLRNRFKEKLLLQTQTVKIETTSSEEAGQSSGGHVNREDFTDQIRIRLKYLNDDQKLVEGRLQEQLGDFKRRHFSLELAADKLVRLIFNGQVLQSDNQTLQGYGLYDNCVVHCLVHNQRSSSNNAAPRNATQQETASNANPPDWNLSTLLYTCLSIILGFAWYCRYHYAQLFTVTTTAALIGLTGIFTVSLLSIYLPDQDGIPQ